VAVCGGLSPGLLQGDPYAELARRLAGTPAWLFHGAEDSTVSPLESRRIHAAFHQAGAPVNYTEYPGVGHNSWDPAFSDSMLWQWLFAQRKRGDREEEP
jgi:predicted peptidase